MPDRYFFSRNEEIRKRQAEKAVTINLQQSIIVSAKIPKSMLGQLYTGGVDTSIFRAGTLTVYGDQLWAFNQAVSGTIRFIK